MHLSRPQIFEARLWLLALRWRAGAALGFQTPYVPDTHEEDREFLGVALAATAMQSLLIAIHLAAAALAASALTSWWQTLFVYSAMLMNLYIVGHLVRAWASFRIDHIDPRRHRLWIADHRALLEAYHERQALARAATPGPARRPDSRRRL